MCRVALHGKEGGQRLSYLLYFATGYGALRRGLVRPSQICPLPMRRWQFDHRFLLTGAEEGAAALLQRQLRGQRE